MIPSELRSWSKKSQQVYIDMQGGAERDESIVRERSRCRSESPGAGRQEFLHGTAYENSMPRPVEFKNYPWNLRNFSHPVGLFTSLRQRGAVQV